MKAIGTQELKLGDIIRDIIKLSPDYGEALAKEFGDDADFIRKSEASEVIDTQPSERIIVGRISSHSIDRDGDVILPQGMDAEDYRKNPVVLWSHDYGGGLFGGTTYELPHAMNAWIKQYPARSPVEIRAGTKYLPAEINEFGDRVYQYRLGGYPLGFSIGFIPTQTVYNDDDEWEKILVSWKRRVAAQTNQDIEAIPEPDRFFTRWKLLEYSDVKIPANQDAVQLMISKGMMDEAERESYTLKDDLIEFESDDDSTDLTLATIDDIKRIDTDLAVLRQQIADLEAQVYADSRDIGIEQISYSEVAVDDIKSETIKPEFDIQDIPPPDVIKNLRKGKIL